MFKIGDKIRVVNPHINNWYEEGQEYVVAGINDGHRSCGEPAHVTVEGETKKVWIFQEHIEVVETLVKENNMNANWKDNLETMCSTELIDLIAKAEEQLKLIREKKENPLRSLITINFWSDHNDGDDIFKALCENASEFIEALEHVKGK